MNMIVLGTNKTNSVFCTLTELTTIDSPYYLMTLKSNATNDVKTFRLGDDLSDNKKRWNIFEITVTGGTENLENAIVNLPVTDYDYSIFQTSASTGTSIVGLTRVESGLLAVTGTTTSPTYFSGQNQSYSYANI